MMISAGLEKVHALAVASAQTPLREREILMVQQALHNARIVTSEQRREFLTTCAGRPITSLRDLRKGDLRLILEHLRVRPADHTMEAI